MEPYNVLFLCTGNSARSIMGEALLNYWGRGRFRAFSAGSHPKGQVHPLTLATLERAHLPVANARSKSWNEFSGPGAPNFDFVFTVCGNAAKEQCPHWPGQPMTAHWRVDDPAAVEGTSEQQLRAFQRAPRELDARIKLFISLPLQSLDKVALRGNGSGTSAERRRRRIEMAAPDACGMGFLASRKGVPERRLVEIALELCRQFDHRGAPGHGAGIQLDIPWPLLLERFPDHARVIAQRDVALGMFFLPFDSPIRRRRVEMVEELAALAGADVLGWAEVPLEVEALPPESAPRRTAPVVRQALFQGRPAALQRPRRGALDPRGFRLRREGARRRLPPGAAPSSPDARRSPCWTSCASLPPASRFRSTRWRARSTCSGASWPPA